MEPKPPASLLRNLREGRCVLFCGSGLSAWARLPTWKAMLELIIEHLGEEIPDSPEIDELRKLLAAGKLLEVADHCKEALGQQYYTILSEKLRGVDEDIPEPHRVITQIPFSAIVTTNYDKLLERAFAAVSSWPKTPTNSDVETLGPLLFDGGFFILKAHGDIDHEDTIVFTSRDYQKIIHANPAFNAVFSALLLTKAILFVGYSLGDPDFRLLLDQQLTHFGGHVPDRYALMSGVGKVERDVLWRSARIRVLPYAEGEHQHVLGFLRSIQQAVGSDAVALAPTDVRRVAMTPRGLSSVSQPSVVSSPSAVRPPAAAVLSLRLAGDAVKASISLGDDVVEGAVSSADLSLLTKLSRGAFKHDAKSRLLSRQITKAIPESVRAKLRETSADDVITLRLPASLETFPWEWIEIDDQPLMLRNPVARSPMGVSDDARGYPILREPTRVLLIGDPNANDGIGLPGAKKEILEIAEIYDKDPGSVQKTLMGPQASFDNVAGEFASGNYDIVHFAGHAWFDDRESYLFLSEKVQLRSSELRSLISHRPPAILFLNSHYTIFTPTGVSGPDPNQLVADDENPSGTGQRGFMDAVSAAGVGCLIGSFSGALDDHLAERVGLVFHERFLQGATTAEALHRALAASVDIIQQRGLHQASYAMCGYSDLALTRSASGA